jgi:hypothetical protein
VRQGLLPDASASALMIPATALAVLALVLALLWARSALITNQGAGKRLGLLALVGAAAFLYPPLSYVYSGLTSLPIHDVSTDTEDPPQFVALAKRPPGANGTRFDGNAMIAYRGEHNTVNYVLHTYYYTLTKPLSPLLPPTLANPAPPMAKMFWRCFNRAKDMGWHIIDYNEIEGRIEAQASSFWFGQISDIVIRIRPAGTLGARFDMRAQTLMGNRDFGHNLELIKTYRTSLNS